MRKKLGLPSTESPASLRVSERTPVGEYIDHEEGDFAFEMEVATSSFGDAVDLLSIDSFLEAGHIPDQTRASLIEEREEAFLTFKHGSFELAKFQLIALHRACRLFGLAVGTRPAVQQQKRTLEDRKKGGVAAAKVRAKLPSREELRNQIDSLMTNRRISEADAKSVIRGRTGASSQAISQKLDPRPKKPRPKKK